MQFNLLCIGDIVGRPGRDALRNGLPHLVERHDVHCVIVNAENAAAGSGLTAAQYKKMAAQGVHLITLGDHVYRRKDIIPILEREQNIVRPANLPTQAPGRQFAVFEMAPGHRIATFSLLGRMHMRTLVDCPFAAADRVLNCLPADVRHVVVDMHAETTSEKVAMGWHLDGRVSVLFGTHTHIPTADERVLPRGTAYITDVGMSGPYASVLGRMTNRVLSSMISGVPTPFDVASEDVRLCGLLATVDGGTGRATAVQRICFKSRGDGEPAA